MNKTLRKAMISTIAMLVVGVMSLTGVTYAWFTQGTYSEVSGLTVQVESATGGIFIAGTANYDEATMPAAGAYTQTLDLNNTSFGANGGVKPVSTVGGSAAFTFYTAEMVTPTTITTAENSNINNIFKYYLYLRNDNTAEDMIINLGGNTITNGTTPATAITANAANGTGKNIEDAARIGMRYIKTTTLDGGEATLAGSVNGTTNFGIFSNEGSTYLGVKKDSTTAFNKDNSEDTTNLGSVSPTGTTSWSISVPKSSIVVVELLVWVEGQDAACVNANAGTKFDVKIYFDRKAS